MSTIWELHTRVQSPSFEASTKVCGPYVATILDHTHVCLEWHMARYKLRMDNKFKKIACCVEIGMYVQNIDTFMGSISNTIKKAYEEFHKEK